MSGIRKKIHKRGFIILMTVIGPAQNNLPHRQEPERKALCSVKCEPSMNPLRRNSEDLSLLTPVFLRRLIRSPGHSDNPVLSIVSKSFPLLFLNIMETFYFTTTPGL